MNSSSVPIRVLTVEDNPGDEQLLREMLGNECKKFDFYNVPTLKQAVEWLSANPCDLVLLDLGLPDGDGLGNIERITHTNPDLPVIVLTGRSGEGLDIAAIRHSAQDFISKGELDTSELLSRIMTYAIERKKAENQMIRIAEDLSRSAQIKTDFVSMVSHELRTPLTVIKEGIGLVADGSLGELNPEQAEYLQIAQRNTERLTRLINDVLDYQKFEAGQMQFRPEPRQLNDVIRENMPHLEPLVQKKGLQIALELQADLPEIQVDADKVSQVLINLVGNAVRFTEKGVITVGTDRRQNVVRLWVKDEGIGIKSEDIGKLFQAFSQIHNQGIHKTGGTGLGLAICKKISELHRGKIGVESAWGQGSTFFLLLPIVERRS